MNLSRIFGIELEVDRIDVGEAFEQDRLAFHHRLAGERAEIAHAEDRGSVRDHGNEVRPGGVFRGVGWIVGNRLHRRGDAGRIGKAEVALGRHRLRRDDLDFTRSARLVIEQRLACLEVSILVVSHLRPFRVRVRPDVAGAVEATPANRQWCRAAFGECDRGQAKPARFPNRGPDR
tara:strand:+ start:2448 stop:2975 length:528 start_codon:yes stop_codon:yes gene_type:complete